MEIILMQDVTSLGYKNDIVKVKDGYARNYLIPRRMAILATEGNRKQLAENLRQQAKKLAEQLAAAQKLAEQLALAPVTVAVKANEDGKIFGTVTTSDIAAALEKIGITVDKRVISVEPVKQLGEHKATARLHREVKAEIVLNVVSEKAEKAEKTEE